MTQNPPDADSLLNERERTHGTYAENSRRYALLRAAMEPIPPGLDYAISGILIKLARIASGDKTHADHWDDIIGYSQLAKKTVEGGTK